MAKDNPHKTDDVIYHPDRPPEDVSVRDWQLGLRRQYGRRQQYRIDNRGDHPVFSDFLLSDPQGGSQYRLAVRGAEPGNNFCSCFDFRTAQLGTCKHLEWLLARLRETPAYAEWLTEGAPPRAYSSLSVDYAQAERRLRLRSGTAKKNKLRELAHRYFHKNGYLRSDVWLELDHFLRQADTLLDDFRCYPDARHLIRERVADEHRLRHTLRLRKEEFPFAGLIRGQLYPYQREGAFFAFRAGRALLADEMGLGKTLQALTAAELLRREMGATSVIVICPAALRYQWRAEIEKFTNSSVCVISGEPEERQRQYFDPSVYYKLVSYERVAEDRPRLNASQPDLIILDEAQRISQYATGIAQAIKALTAPHRIALTGRIPEQAPEELYSIVQFLDQYRLGPLWQLRDAAKVDTAALLARLDGLLLRRRRKDVGRQLPGRVNQRLLVPLTQEQRRQHDAALADVRHLLAKWRREGFLNEKHRHRLLQRLRVMCLVCNSTQLLDRKQRHDTKIDEVLYLLEDRLSSPKEKVVIFSQYPAMVQLLTPELTRRGIRFAVPAEDQPGPSPDRFQEDDQCRVFLGTDGSGEGLNLQRAALVINLDLPWNPATLEHRVTTVHRLGQKKSVQVIHLVSEGTIEHHLALALRKPTAPGEFTPDRLDEELLASHRKFNGFMQYLDRILTATPTEVPGQAVSDSDVTVPRAAGSASAGPSRRAPATDHPASDLAGEVGLGSWLAEVLAAGDDTATLSRLADRWTEQDPAGKTFLRIPVAGKAAVVQLFRALAALFGK